MNPYKVYGRFRKLGVPYFGVLLLFGVPRFLSSTLLPFLIRGPLIKINW